MANRLVYAILATVFGASMLLGACSDDSGSSADARGGDSSSAGVDSGGSASGGSSAGKAGSGGKGGTGSAGMTQAGATQGGSPAEGGAGGETTLAGAPASGGAADAGAPGMGGETSAGGAGGAPGVDYACNSTTIVHKLCSALSAADCQIATDCPDCVQTRTSERATFAECPACLAWNDAFYQCAIDAYESHDLAAGVECVDDPDAGIGADVSFDCAMQYLFPALDCLDYLADPQNECPATWPLN